MARLATEVTHIRAHTALRGIMTHTATLVTSGEPRVTILIGTGRDRWTNRTSHSSVARLATKVTHVHAYAARRGLVTQSATLVTPGWSRVTVLILPHPLFVLLEKLRISLK